MSNRSMKTKILKHLIVNKYRGKYRLFKILLELGALNCYVDLDFYCGRITIPADQFDFWKLCNPEHYQIGRITVLAQLINKELQQFDLLDLGADIGVVSREIHHLCPKLRSIIAIEPNPHSYFLLKQNLDRVNIDSIALNLAVSDFSGYASLVFDKSRKSDHSGYLDINTTGDTKVRMVDEIYTAGSDDIVIKLDVEGQEHAVLRGAKEIIGRSKRLVLFMEIHKTILEKRAISPEMIFRYVEETRPCLWFLSEQGLPRINRKLPFFDQFPEVTQHDVIGLMSPSILL